MTIRDHTGRVAREGVERRVTNRKEALNSFHILLWFDSENIYVADMLSPHQRHLIRAGQVNLHRSGASMLPKGKGDMLSLEC